MDSLLLPAPYLKREWRLHEAVYGVRNASEVTNHCQEWNFMLNV